MTVASGIDVDVSAPNIHVLDNFLFLFSRHDLSPVSAIPFLVSDGIGLFLLGSILFSTRNPIVL